MSVLPGIPVSGVRADHTVSPQVVELRRDALVVAVQRFVGGLREIHEMLPKPGTNDEAGAKELIQDAMVLKEMLLLDFLEWVGASNAEALLSEMHLDAWDVVTRQGKTPDI